MTNCVLAVALSLAVIGAACGDEGQGQTSEADGPLGTSDTSETAETAASLDGLTGYDDLASLQDAIVAGGWTCELEYEGLEDADTILSLCVIDDEQVTLKIWKQPSSIEDLVASDIELDLVVYGANWTLDVASAELATALASALGGASGS